MIHTEKERSDKWSSFRRVEDMLLNMSSLCMKCFLVGSVVKNSPANAGLILGWEDILEEEMATHSSILALEIP